VNVLARRVGTRMLRVLLAVLLFFTPEAFAAKERPLKPEDIPPLQARMRVVSIKG